jgi:VWFA-related protein
MFTETLAFRFKQLSGVLALAAILLAQPMVAQAPMKEVIDVRVTNVEIIATDSKGNHVPGLTRDDFELYENGKLQPITNLFEVNAGASPSASNNAARKTTLPRRIVIYLDDSTLLPNNRKPIIPALKKLVADTMTTDDQMMIVTFDQSSKTRLPWTNDPAAVQSTLDTIGREVGGGRTPQANRDRIENEIRSMVSGGPGEVEIGVTRGPGRDFRSIVTTVRNYASSVNLDFGRSAAALESLFGSLAGVDGRKIVVIASESFPTRPGGDVFAYLENVRNQILSGAGSERLRRSARTATTSADAAAFNTNETILMLGRIANAAGVTIYAIDPDTGGGSTSGNVEQIGPNQMQAGISTTTAGVDGLQILAAATGGQAWIGMKPGVAFEKLRADLENYYSIGYRARTSGDAERAIEVRPKRADIRVRAQKSIVFRTAESEMSARVTSNLQAAQVNDLGISVQVAGDVMTEGDNRRVPVHVLIPARNITVAAEGDVLTGGFSVYFCTAGGKPEASAVTRRTHEIRWTPETVKQLGDDGNITFSTKVVLEKGQDLISVGVLDHRSQATGFSKIAM